MSIHFHPARITNPIQLYRGSDWAIVMCVAFIAFVIALTQIPALLFYIVSGIGIYLFCVGSGLYLLVTRTSSEQFQRIVEITKLVSEWKSVKPTHSEEKEQCVTQAVDEMLERINSWHAHVEDEEPIVRGPLAPGRKIDAEEKSSSEGYVTEFNAHTKLNDCQLSYSHDNVKSYMPCSEGSKYKKVSDM